MYKACSTQRDLMFAGKRKERRKKSTKEDERGKYKRGRQRRSERDTQTNREQLMKATLRDLSSD